MVLLRFRPNLTWRFALTAFVIIAALGYVLFVLLSQAISSTALRNARNEARDTVGRRVLRVLTPEDLSSPMTGQRLVEFDRFVKESIVSDRTARIKVWNRAGRVVYSDDHSIIGESYPIGDELEEALAGETASELSIGDQPENVEEGHLGTLLEVYTPISFSGSPEVLGAFEIYQVYLPVAQQISELRRYVTICLGGGLAVLYLALIWVVRGGARTIDRQHRALRDSEQRFRSLIQNLSDLIIVVDASGRMRYVSPSIELVLGYTPGDFEGGALIGRDPEIVHWEDVDRFHTLLTELAGHPIGDSSIQLRMQHRDGSWHYLDVVATNLLSEPSVDGIVLTAHDVSQAKRYEEELTRRALYDSLSSLPNRALFTERLAHALVRAKRTDQRVAMLFVDLDNFKLVNDSLGHQAGDQLLVRVAERIQKCVRQEDTAARLGGDEFTILLEDAVDEGDAIRVAERILEELQTPVALDTQEVFVSASIGIALSSRDHDEPNALLRDADIAMYRAKTHGKGRYEIYDIEMGVMASERLQLETDLRHAMERGEFRLFYQPIVQLDSQRIEGVEALIRWEHPRRGLILPTEFIPVAEETGLIIHIGKWVIEQACRQAKDWQTRLPGAQSLVMSVNLSPRQFQGPTLVEDISRILKETGIPPDCLKLELTEGAMMYDTEAAISTLDRLKSLGIHIAIDDFGTGYSSLAYLKRFPIDTLKIDKLFIDGLANDQGSNAIIQAVLMFARSMHFTVTAEGIEAEEQMDRLREMGCPQGQGFYFAKPMDRTAMDRLLGITTGRSRLAAGKS